MKLFFQISCKTVLFVSLLLSQACTPAATSGLDVANAYETSGLLPAKPYTRTIFSTHNF
jgi:hypothetical protein